MKKYQFFIIVILFLLAILILNKMRAEQKERDWREIRKLERFAEEDERLREKREFDEMSERIKELSKNEGRMTEAQRKKLFDLKEDLKRWGQLRLEIQEMEKQEFDNLPINEKKKILRERMEALEHLRLLKLRQIYGKPPECTER